MPKNLHLLALAFLTATTMSPTGTADATMASRSPIGVVSDARGDTQTTSCATGTTCSTRRHTGPLDITRATAVRTATAFRVTVRVPRPRAAAYHPEVETSEGVFHSDGQSLYVQLATGKQDGVSFQPAADGTITRSDADNVACAGGSYRVTESTIAMTIPVACAGRAGTSDRPRFSVATRHLRSNGSEDIDMAPEYYRTALVAVR